jgi:hypothetical protein
VGKVCKGCGATGNYYAKGMCRLCWQKDYRANNAGIVRAYNKAYWRDNKDKLRVRERQGRLKKEYGLSIQDYEKLLGSQGGVCKICLRYNSRKGLNGTLIVDHDHDTGVVRGLLCHGCNVGLGHFRDSPELLEEAIAYLREAA